MRYPRIHQVSYESSLSLFYSTVVNLKTSRLILINNTFILDSRTTFHHCPFLQRHESKVDELVNEWRQYKSAVPTYGAIMLDKSMESVVMVQGYYAKNSWGFPKGKV